MAAKLHPGLRRFNGLIWKQENLISRMNKLEKAGKNYEYSIVIEMLDGLAGKIEKEGKRITSYFSN